MIALSRPMRLFCWCVLICLVAPSLVVIPMAFSNSVYMEMPTDGLSLRWFQEFIFDPGWQKATLRSFRVAATVTVLATSMATCAVIVFDRLTRAVRRIAFSLIISPMIIPVIAYAVAIYGVYPLYSILDLKRRRFAKALRRPRQGSRKVV